MTTDSQPSGQPPAQPSVAEDVAARLSTYRTVREEVERRILPQATSLDGRTFTFQASLYDLTLARGGYVELDAPDGTVFLGQITDLRVRSSSVGGEVGGLDGVFVRAAAGEGVVLDGGVEGFHDAEVRPAGAEQVQAWVDRTRRGDRAQLHVGEYVFGPGVEATLDSGGFDRHTFMCGQSGSGKTYSLGLLLERILAETSLPLVILDPNSDYVGLGRVRDSAPSDKVARYAGVPEQVQVWSNGPYGDHELHVRFPDLQADTQSAVLALDPLRDRDEYAALQHRLATRLGKGLINDPAELFNADDEGTRALGRRAANLGVLNWKVWSPDKPSLIDELRNPTARCVVVDLGSLGTQAEQRLVSEAVLSTLWEQRMRKRPTLIVMDEAHNICPADPPDEMSALATERAVQIAAEGRKFGLYQLTSTQRPNKVAENVVSQCDNLLLMRMNSSADLLELGRLLSFAPEGLVAGSTGFAMGQVLVAGKVMPRAAYVQMGERVSEEGGADIATDWATPR